MTTLLNIALINSVAVLPLAVLAIVVCRLARRPALTHAVWVLVLLKFVTPPLFQSPVTIEVPAETWENSGKHVSSKTMRPPFSNPASDEPWLADAPLVTRVKISPSELASTITAKPVTSSSQPVVRRGDPSVVASPLPSLVTSWTRRSDLRSMLLIGWLCGAAVWMAVQFVRAVRFQRRVVRNAKSNGELQQQTAQLAAALGLRRGPRVLIVNAAVSPMLWGCGSRAKLLFPSDLAERLDANARATLLTHELAHFARGDHWVRLLELIATGLFWWHPVVWWARRQIEEAEEECCDAWVVSQFPEMPRQYAEALLDTIDFLCESRRPLPPIACGLGQAHFIRHRLTKIMRGASPKMLSQRVRYVTLLAAGLLLPMQPFVFGSAGGSNLQSEFHPSAVAVDFGPVGSSDPIEQDEIQSTTDNTSMTPPAFPSAVLSTETTDSVPPSRILPLRGEKVWSTAASPDGRFVVRTTTARRVVLTDLMSNNETDLSKERITAVAFAPDGNWFAAAHQDGRVTIWDSSRGNLLRIIRTHTDALRSLAVSPGGQTIAAAGRDGTVLLIDSITGESRADVPSYSSAVNCVRFSSDGRQLAVAVGDWRSNGRGEVSLLNAVTGKSEVTLRCPTTPGALTFASNEELIVGLWDGRTQLWNLVNRQVVGTALADKSVVSAAAFSPDNPALREAIFIAEVPNPTGEPSPQSFLQGLFAAPAK